jgi:integrase
MARDQSPHTAGKFWLDRRPDRKSPAWQIAWYDEKARTVRYRSTGCAGLDDAINALDAHYLLDKASAPQDTSAGVVEQLVLYWREHGKHTVSPGQIASSLRQFIAFLGQDRVTSAVTFAELRPDVFQRFQRWRMSPHSYVITWAGKVYRHSSPGVRGESVQRNLDDVRAALNHAAGAGRVPFAPKVKGVKRELRSEPRNRILTRDEMAAIVGYALDDPPLLRFVVSIIATLSRPEAALQCDVAAQADFERGLIDLHPPGAPRTKKHNPIVRIPRFYGDWLLMWLRHGPALPATSMRTRWRTMRRVLGLGPDVTAKTIRHTLATMMDEADLPEGQIKRQLGHSRTTGATGSYLHFRPGYLTATSAFLDAYWLDLMFAVRSWRADHLRTRDGRGPVFLRDNSAKYRLQSQNVVGGGR